jgi:hypothetical protein
VNEDLRCVHAAETAMDRHRFELFSKR